VVSLGGGLSVLGLKDSLKSVRIPGDGGVDASPGDEFGTAAHLSHRDPLGYLLLADTRGQGASDDYGGLVGRTGGRATRCPAQADDAKHTRCKTDNQQGHQSPAHDPKRRAREPAPSRVD
jgi:hypothetical protein